MVDQKDQIDVFMNLMESSDIELKDRYKHILVDDLQDGTYVIICKFKYVTKLVYLNSTFSRNLQKTQNLLLWQGMTIKLFLPSKAFQLIPFKYSS